MVKIKRKRISHVVQAKALEKEFPEGDLSLGHNGFKWISNFSPTPMSYTYSVKLIYKVGNHPDVFVLTKLKLAKGKKVLPHVYNTKKQHLCLYHRKSGQWNSRMLISNTIIPWTNEWLYFYEYWLIDGIWYGGGIGHEKQKPYTN